MTPIRAQARRPILVAGAALAVAWSTAWSLTAAPRLSATFDEPAYLATGLEHWRTGSPDALMRLGVMPLPVDLVTAPLYLVERVRGRAWDISADPRGLVTGAADVPDALPIARATALIFWWVLLYWAWRAGRFAAGSGAGGVLAVALMAIEPTLLAHATLATADIAVTGSLLAVATLFAEGRDASSWWRRRGHASLWFGLALSSKASALMAGPLVMAAVAARSGNVRRGARDVGAIAGLGLLLAFLYCGSGWHAQPDFVEWTRARPSGRVNGVLRWTSQHLAVFSNAGEGFTRQVRHNVQGTGAFLLGRATPHPVWYYFPVALSIKTSSAMLIACPLALWMRRRGALTWPTIAALALLASSVTYRVQTGVRFVLPALVLLIVGVAVALASAMRDGRGWRRKLAVATAAAAIAWNAVAAARAWPDAIRFTNELWGGTPRGFELLSDSNYDWGQGLVDLMRWQRESRAANVDLWYWGADPRAATGPWRLTPLHQREWQTKGEVVRALEGRCLAVSTTLLRGAVFDVNARSAESRAAARRARLVIEALATRRPAARTSTFLIYDFAGGNAATRDAARPADSAPPAIHSQ